MKEWIYIILRLSFSIKTLYHLWARFMFLEFNESRTNLSLHVYQLTISWEENK